MRRLVHELHGVQRSSLNSNIDGSMENPTFKAFYGWPSLVYSLKFLTPKFDSLKFLTPKLFTHVAYFCIFSWQN